MTTHARMRVHHSGAFPADDGEQLSLFDDPQPQATGTAPGVDVEACSGCGELREIRIRDRANEPVCAECLCECCGDIPWQCPCVITVVDGYDRETGPYADRGCEFHKCGA